MILLVCGGRDYDDHDHIHTVLDRIHAQVRVKGEPAQIVTLVHGAAAGADTQAGIWAKRRGVAVMEFPANWNEHGRAAGHIRNAQMLEEGQPDLVLAFPGGKGTKSMVRKAWAAGVPIILMPRPPGAKK